MFPALTPLREAPILRDASQFFTWFGRRTAAVLTAKVSAFYEFGGGQHGICGWCDGCAESHSGI
jgi:hypothetical protein